MLTLKELAIHIPASIHLFEKYDLDYYRNGKQTLRAACDEKGLSFDLIDAELSGLQESSGMLYSFTLEDMSTDRLIDFINGRYHSNEEQLLAGIQADIQQLLNDRDNAQYPILLEIEPVFERLREQLLLHCKKEDEVLFPLMRKLAVRDRNKTLKAEPSETKGVKHSIRMLRGEHALILELFAAVRQAARKFFVPEDATPEYMALMTNLTLFEQDMHMHLHIENNVLFPRLLAMSNES